MPAGKTTPGTPSTSRTSPAASDSPGIQLPQADIAQATQPSLWDGVDVEAFGVDRAREIAEYKFAERMLLALSLVEVSPTARIIAAIVAYYGWIAWPSQDLLAKLSRIDKRHVGRAIGELTRAGIWRTSKTRKRNKVVMQYAFSGMAIGAAFCAVRGEEWDYQIDNPTGDPEHQYGVPTPDPEHQYGVPTPDPEHHIGTGTRILSSSNPERRTEPGEPRVKKSVLEEKRKPAGKPAASTPAGTGGPDVDSRETSPSEDVPPPPAAAVQEPPPEESAPPPLPRRVTEPPKPIYHPDFPPDSFQAGYCKAMLEHYRKTWLDSWAKDIGDVVRWYSKRWPKFLEDLQRHRANELDNQPYGAGLAQESAGADPPEMKIDPIRCDKCGIMTTKPRGQKFRFGGEILVDGCQECSPVSFPPLKDLVNQRGGV